ncbi:TetR/AcrR family transcriptional regulator [Luethyella okanaganae]|uniref:TetR/AcrR family transcriptional regulator n=1 Tax=Luethyella okanaganae TaxID=69372 RepID=A0ABW1VJB1_9MICO
MPKVVDHEAHRAELAAAVWRVIGRGGMSSATVRAVAAEAGVSPGALRHYFSDQAGLLRFAAEMMTQRVVERLRGHMAEGDTGRELSQRLLEEMLPLDEDRRIEVIVWLEGLSQARLDPQLAGLKTAGWFGERHVCRIAWASARDLAIPQQATDEFSNPIDELAVDKLHTFLDGLTLQAVAFPEHVSREDVSRRLREFISMLLVNAERTTSP